MTQQGRKTLSVLKDTLSRLQGFRNEGALHGQFFNQISLAYMIEEIKSAINGIEKEDCKNSCQQSCSSSDWYAGGKFDQNKCFQQ